MSATRPDLTTPAITEALLGESAAEFLQNLPGPAWLELGGEDRSRRRAIVTLLHGNEPSGLKAVWQILKNGIRPATDLAVIVAAVDAARHPPLFSHRFIPGEKDLNRCFAPPYVSSQGQLAENIVTALNGYRPEAIVDTHNTSAHSPPFCVSVRHDLATSAIASLFADHLIVINQRLGTLLEHVSPDIPVVTAEFGAFMDPLADTAARDTLLSFIAARHLPASEVQPVTLLDRSLRLETSIALPVAYGSSLIDDVALTMINTIDQLNFRRVPAGHTLGWFTSLEHGHLRVTSDDGTDVFAVYFSQDDGLLTTKTDMTVFMATTDPVVANTDCLLYFNPV